MASATDTVPIPHRARIDRESSMPAYAWGAVDQTRDPAWYVDYLGTVSSFDLVRAYKQRSFALLEPAPGATLLDVGCGVGDDVRAMAALVEPHGCVVGLDSSATMIEEARRRIDDRSHLTLFRAGDAHNLPFADGTFDGCRADRTFQHLEDPARALAELIRVARPGAPVVLFEPDWGTLIVDAADRPVTQAILGQAVERIRHGWMGRQLSGLFHRAGLVGVAVIGGTLPITDFATASHVFNLELIANEAAERGIVSPDVASSWLDELVEADRAGRFFAAMSAYIARGRTPAGESGAVE